MKWGAQVLNGEAGITGASAGDGPGYIADLSCSMLTIPNLYWS